MGLKGATWIPAHKKLMCFSLPSSWGKCALSHSRITIFFPPVALLCWGKQCPPRQGSSLPHLLPVSPCRSVQPSNLVCTRCQVQFWRHLFQTRNEYSYSKINTFVNLLSGGENERWAPSEQSPSLQLSPIINNSGAEPYTEDYFFSPKAFVLKQLFPILSSNSLDTSPFPCYSGVWLQTILEWSQLSFASCLL